MKEKEKKKTAACNAVKAIKDDFTVIDIQIKSLTFLRQPARLGSDADAPAVVFILRRSAQVVPCTLGTDAAQVRAVRFDAFIHPLLLELNKSHTHETLGPTQMINNQKKDKNTI